MNRIFWVNNYLFLIVDGDEYKPIILEASVKPNVVEPTYKSELEKTIKSNLENTIKSSLANQLKPNVENPLESNGSKPNALELTNGSSNYFDHYDANNKITKKPSIYDKVCFFSLFYSYIKILTLINLIAQVKIF